MRRATCCAPQVVNHVWVTQFGRPQKRQRGPDFASTAAAIKTHFTRKCNHLHRQLSPIVMSLWSKGKRVHKSARGGRKKKKEKKKEKKKTERERKERVDFFFDFFFLIERFSGLISLKTQGNTTSRMACKLVVRINSAHFRHSSSYRSGGANT